MASHRKPTLWLGPKQRARLQTAVILLIVIVLVILLVPYFNGIAQMKNFQTCQNNLRKIQEAMQVYMGDWDGTFPLATNWSYAVSANMSATSGMAKSVSIYFKCPLDHSKKPWSYAYNTIYSGYNPNSGETQFTFGSGKNRQILPRPIHPNSSPIIFEHFASNNNQHFLLRTWGDLRNNMTFPHMLPDPTGNYIAGNGRIYRLTPADLSEDMSDRL